MKLNLRPFRPDLKQPWQIALLLIALVPLFPEYICFPLVLGAGFFAWRELKVTGQKLKIGLIGKIVLIYIGYMLLSAVYSRNIGSTLSTVGMWAVLFIVYLVCTNLLTDPLRFNTLMLWITAVAGMVGFIACCQYRIGFFTNGNPIEVWGWLDDLVYNILPIRLSGSSYVLRACSTYANPNMLSEYLTAIAPFVIYFNFHERKQEIRLFCRVCLFLTFAGILFSFSRGGYIALLLLLLALLLLNIRHHFATVATYVFGALLLLPEEVVERFLTILPGISSVLTAPPAVEGITGASGNYTTTADIINQTTTDIAISTRWDVWAESLQSFLERPLFGLGAGVHNTWEMLEEKGLEAAHAHNIALELLVEGGIIAFLLIAAIGILVIKRGVELLRAGYGTAFWVGFAVIGFAGCFCIQGMVDYPLMSPKLVCNFLMLIAVSEASGQLYTGRAMHLRQTVRQKLRRKTIKE